MTQGPWLFRMGAAFGLLALALAWLAGAFEAKLAPGLAPSGASQAAGWVLVAEQRPRFETVAGTIEAEETTVIASRLLARITTLPVRAGDQVARGALLVTLERDDLEAQRGQAQEALRGAEARTEESARTLERVRTLRDEGLVAQADLDRARSRAEEEAGALATAKRALDAAEAALAYAEIRAPFAGRIVDRFLEPGAMAAPGQKILSLYNPASLQVAAYVRESLAVSLAADAAFTLEVPALGQRLEARIAERVPAAEPSARRFLIKGRFPSAEGLLPGMYARLLLPAGTETVLVVPDTYLRRYGQLEVVWVAGPAGPERRFVRVGAREGGGWRVLSGLEAGERLLPPPEA
jgi:membrane fusion protein (multidrug efflux system)